jgi:hypothetical protein
MDPIAFCNQALAQARSAPRGESPALDALQIRVVLLHFTRQDLSEPGFSLALKQLIATSERMQRPGLAAAGRAVLRDWQARSAMG